MRRTLRRLGGQAYASVLSLRKRVESPIQNLAFELNWNYLANPRGAREFLSRYPRLDAIQQRVLDDLRARGFALVHFHQLLPEPAQPTYDVAMRTILDWSHQPAVLEAARQYQQNPDTAAWKEYVVKMFGGDRPLIPWSHPLLQLALNHRLLDLVSAYLGLWARLLSVNAWYTVPLTNGERKRIASQRWHRDPEDRRLLKVFLYATEVREECGPLEYVPSTRTDGPSANLAPPAAGVARYNYPPRRSWIRRSPGPSAWWPPVPQGPSFYATPAAFIAVVFPWPILAFWRCSPT